jgi:hypothetical protein
MPSLALALRDKANITDRERAKKSLWFLATEILGYDRLTKDFHKPMLDRADAMRQERIKGKGKDSLWLWAREHYKTTCRKAQVIQDLLWDPTTSIAWWHAVEEKAEEVAIALAHQIQDNNALRRIFPPDALPSKASKRFVQAKGFRLPTAHYDQPQTFRAWGAGSEATGGHAAKGYMDDPITLADVESGGMDTKRRWYRTTVRNVVLKSGWFDATGTRWSHDDIYQDWIESPYWEVNRRAAIEDEAQEPDLKGKPVLLNPHLIRKAQEEMGPFDFAMQMQNDPAPTGAIPWDPSSCEHVVDHDTIMKAQGRTIVLVDPAPSGGMSRGDGDKDFWAIAVIKIRNRGEFMSKDDLSPRKEYILVWGEQSQNWTLDVGIARMLELKKTWRADAHIFDFGGPAGPIYREKIREASTTLGASRGMVELDSTGRGRNMLFASFCELARCGRFLMSNRVPEGFLNAFLYQCRRWRPLKDNKNGLRHDDAANAVAYVADPSVQRLAASGSALVLDGRNWQRMKAAETGYGGRYLSW